MATTTIKTIATTTPMTIPAMAPPVSPAVVFAALEAPSGNPLGVGLVEGTVRTAVWAETPIWKAAGSEPEAVAAADAKEEKAKPTAAEPPAPPPEPPPLPPDEKLAADALSIGARAARTAVTEADDCGDPPLEGADTEIVKPTSSDASEPPATSARAINPFIFVGPLRRREERPSLPELHGENAFVAVLTGCDEGTRTAALCTEPLTTEIDDMVTDSRETLAMHASPERR